jgi:iron complex outermembrane receptor protein
MKTIIKPTLLSIAIASAIGSTQYGLAADTEDDVTGAEIEEVTVTGIRRALMRSQEVKMDSSSIVEALSAEDIGKLPDSSIAESLARLPGLAGERSGGRTSGIAVRGFKEDFTGTTLNGRELIGIGDNRGVEYDLYPSEIMTGAVVYKAADAALITQGIGGTVDLRTVRPLDADATLTLNGVFERTGRESDNPDYDESGHRYALSWVDQFADDTIGIALTYADTSSPTNQRNYGVWGYGDNGTGALVPFGLDIHSVSKELTRDTFSGVFQFSPSEDIDLVVDYLKVEYEDGGISRGIVEPFSASNISGSGANNSGTQIGSNPVIRTDPESTTGELENYGLNLQWHFSDKWSATVDIARSESKKNYQKAETYAGLGRNGSITSDQFGTREYVMSQNGIFFTDSTGLDLTDWDSIKLAGPQQWGGGLAALADEFESDEVTVQGVPYSYLNAQDGFWNTADFSEELDQFRLDLAGEVDFGIIKSLNFGFHYSDRTKEKDNNGFFATTNTYPFGSSDGVVDGVIPEQYRQGLADLSWAGLGKIVAFDGTAPYRDGTYILSDAGLLEPDRLGDTFVVEEEVTTLYFKADYETSIAGIDVYGNIGFQYIDTDQSSTGFIGIVDDTFSVCVDESSETGISQSCSVSNGASYTEFLPSFNINFALSDTDIVRIAASKTISRPRIDQMKASGFVKFEQNIEIIATPNTIEAVDEFGSPWSKTQGTPTLRPLESNNFDISYEKYFGNEGYVALTYFYKDLVNWTRDGNATINFRNDPSNNGADYFIPGFHDRVIQEDGNYGPLDTPYSTGDVVTPPDYGTFSFFEDGLTGQMDGIELTANIPLGLLSESLDGLGIAGSMSFIDGELDDGTRIPGQSDETYSLTVYYEFGGFEFRVAGTKRSDYLTYERGGSNKITAADRGGVTIVDAQLSYDFADFGNEKLDGLRVSLQGTNLTDEGDETFDDNGIISRNREFGPVYMLNLNYAFY